jgi:alpha-1,2-mannosyltransferase
VVVGEATLQQSMANRRPSPAFVALASLVAALIWLRWGGVREGIWVDLDVYVSGASAVRAHEPLYAVSVHGLPFTYPPFAAVLFVPLGLLGNTGAQWVLTLASVGCYGLVIALCARRLGMRPGIAAMVALVGLTFEPLLRNILLGQINLVLLALVIVDCLVVPPRYRGVLIGIATGIKLLPGAFILYLVLRRQWWAVARAAAAVAVTVAVGAVFAPGDSWRFWSGGFINLSRFGQEAIIGGDNQSLSAAFMRLSHDLSPPPVLLLVMSGAVMALGLVAAKGQIDGGNEVNALVCIGFASLLASPVSWTHHWVWAVIALLVLVQSRRHVAAALLATLFVIGPMWFAPRGRLIELTHNWWQTAACLSYVGAGLAYLVFFAASRHRAQTSRAAT